MEGIEAGFHVGPQFANIAFDPIEAMIDPVETAVHFVEPTIDIGPKIIEPFVDLLKSSIDRDFESGNSPIHLFEAEIDPLRELIHPLFRPRLSHRLHG